MCAEKDEEDGDNKKSGDKNKKNKKKNKNKNNKDNGDENGRSCDMILAGEINNNLSHVSFTQKVN